jgi:hypothetical protein
VSWPSSPPRCVRAQAHAPPRMANSSVQHASPPGLRIAMITLHLEISREYPAARAWLSTHSYRPVILPSREPDASRQRATHMRTRGGSTSLNRTRGGVGHRSCSSARSVGDCGGGSHARRIPRPAVRCGWSPRLREFLTPGLPEHRAAPRISAARHTRRRDVASPTGRRVASPAGRDETW